MVGILDIVQLDFWKWLGWSASFADSLTFPIARLMPTDLRIPQVIIYKGFTKLIPTSVASTIFRE